MILALHSVQGLAHKLLLLERSTIASGLTDIQLSLSVCAKLQIPLTRFAGPVGFSSLLSRALALASVDSQSLQNIYLGPDGVLRFSEASNTMPTLKHADANLNEGSLLIAHLLALIKTFIGEHLMITLLCDAWPNVSFDKVELDIEEKS